MFGFYLCAALMVVLACWLLLRVLLGNPNGDASINIARQAIKAELHTLQQLHADGIVTDADFQQQREILSQQALSIVAGEVPKSTKPDGAWRLAIGLLVLLPVSVGVIYHYIGNRQAMRMSQTLAEGTVGQSGVANNNTSAEPNANAAEVPKTGPDLKKATENLRARLDKEPNDGEGWLLLGRAYLEIQDFRNAKDALAQAVKLLPPDADLFAQYGEAIALSERPNPPPADAEVQIDRALQLDADNDRALWLKGVLRRFAGDNAGASVPWKKLHQKLPAGSEIANTLQAQIDALDSAATTENTSDATAAASTPSNESVAPDPTDVGPSVSVSVDITPELKAKIAETDVLYIYIKAKDGPPMPLAIHRASASELPVTVTLTDANAMMEQMKLSNFDDVIVGARISKTGIANATPGDYQSATINVKLPTDQTLQLLINDVLK